MGLITIAKNYIADVKVNRELKEVAGELTKRGCKKVTQKIAPNGTRVVLGFKETASDSFSHSFALKPNGTTVYKQYSNGSFVITCRTKTRNILTRITPEGKNPIEKSFYAEYWGDGVDNKIPTVTKEVLQGSKNKVERKTTFDTKKGIFTKETTFPSNNVYQTLRSLKDGRVLGRTINTSAS